MAGVSVVWTAKLYYFVSIIRTDATIEVCDTHVKDSETRVEKKMQQIHS